MRVALFDGFPLLYCHQVVFYCFFGSNTVGTASETKPVSQSETLLIGSGPLPARAPPEKKPPAVIEPAVIPKISQLPPPPVSSATVSIPQPVVAPAPVPPPVPPPAKPVVASTSLPKLTQPLPLAGRPPLPNMARGVAAAFLEQDDDDAETSAAKTLMTGVSTLSAQNSIAAKKAEASRAAGSKVPAPVPPPVTSTVTATTKATTAKTDLMLGLSGMSYSDMVLAAQMQTTSSSLPYDRGDGKGLGRGHSKARASESNRRSSAKKSHPPGRHRLSTDSKGRKKLEIGRNVM